MLIIPDGATDVAVVRAKATIAGRDATPQMVAASRRVTQLATVLERFIFHRRFRDLPGSAEHGTESQEHHQGNGPDVREHACLDPEINMKRQIELALIAVYGAVLLAGISAEAYASLIN